MVFEGLRHCFTTGGYCPPRQDIVPECVTEGFCGGKRGPRTFIVPLHWKPLQWLDESDVSGSIMRAQADAPGAQVSLLLSEKIVLKLTHLVRRASKIDPFHHSIQHTEFH